MVNSNLHVMQPLGRITFKVIRHGNPHNIVIDVDEYTRVREWLMQVPMQKPYTSRMLAVMRILQHDITLREMVAIDRWICEASGLTFRLTDHINGTRSATEHLEESGHRHRPEEVCLRSPAR